MPFLVRTCLAALLCMFATLPAHAADGAVQLYLRAHLTLAADGSLQAIEWGKERRVPDALRAKLEERIRTWSFEPGALDGVPAETETTLRLRLTAEPDGSGDAYQVRIDHAETGPSMSLLAAPEYPREALRDRVEGQLLMEVRVDPDGTRHVALAGYKGQKIHRNLLEKPVRAVLVATEIIQERVGGHAVAARFAVPFGFCLGTSCDVEWTLESDDGSSIPTTAPGAPVPQGSVARLVTDVRGTGI